MKSSLRPFVFINMAMTADGKIATANRGVSSFGSKRDQEHLLELRATADAVMCGARTVESDVVTLGPGPARFRRRRRRRGLAEYNLRILVSGSGSIRPDAQIFQYRFSPILLLTTARAGRGRIQRLSRRFDEIKVCGKEQVDFVQALAWLRRRWGVRRLLCEGGGELNSALWRAGVVDELHLTVCPKIFGGRHAPTIAEGRDLNHLTEAAPLRLKSSQRVGEEWFLVYRVVR
jgi:riboflavin-specific deaminase-like protein